MDKQKQIEEMAKELCCFYDKQKRKCSNCFGMEEDCDLHCSFGRTIERLSNAGYRKIPDGAVVLDKKVFERIKAQEYINGKQDGSKETAERLKEVLGSRFNYIDSLIESKIDEICKEITEGSK